MNKKITNCRNIIIVLFFAVLIFSPYLASAALEVAYPIIPGAEAPQIFMEKIKSGVLNANQALPLYVLYFYTLTIILSGILAFGSVIYGVVRYLISAGSVSQMIAAKEQIANAIIGLLIILSSYVIMTTVDPKMLVSISKPVTPAGPAINYPGGYAVLMDYIEVPLGRLTESVIKKGWEAENAAAVVQAAAEYLSTLTGQLANFTNPPTGSRGCNCSRFDSRCYLASCGGSCEVKDGCTEVRTELDSLIINRIIPPVPGGVDPTPNSCTCEGQPCVSGNTRRCDNDFYLYIDPGSLSYNLASKQLFYTISIRNNPLCPADWQGYRAHGVWVNEPWAIWQGGIPADLGVGMVASILPVSVEPGNSGTICSTVMMDSNTYGCRTGNRTANICCNVAIDNSGMIGATTCSSGGTGPILIKAKIPAAIDALKAARCRASEAQSALAKELLRLKLAEGLLRDSQASPLTYETFIAFEGENANVIRIPIWDSVNLETDPYDDPEDPYINEPDGTDPATFYVPVDGNEYIIELSRNAFFQFQPANGCGGLGGGGGGGGSPPAACTASVIDPFPAFYQYGPSGVVNPWQNSPIDACSPSNLIMNYGCGPTSLAMIVKSITGRDVNPTIIANQLRVPSSPAEYTCGSGATFAGLQRIASDYGLNSVSISDSQISSHIAKKHPVLAYCQTTFGNPNSEHLTVIKGDNCIQFLFQDTVYGERWENKTVVKDNYKCNTFLAFCNASEGADCGVPVIPPGPAPVGNFIAVDGTNCSENRSTNKDLNPELARNSFMEKNNTIAKQADGYHAYIDRVPLYNWTGFDAGAPYLNGLVGRRPDIYEVFSLKSPSSLEALWPIHGINLWGGTTGETVRVPDATGYDIGGGFEALVAYADSNSITLNYLREDQVAIGYAVQINNINVDPNIVKAYQDNEACVSTAGGIKRNLLALKVGDPVGTTSQRVFFVIIRDSGAFMDPRLIQDWWEP
ncbi:MAG: C39 family peptidase [bacterium]